MALHGPTSVLDHRELDRDCSAHIVRDRLTRHRSPSGLSNRNSYTKDDGTDDQDIITPRIPQPYKTSFSAIAPPERQKRDRSRSTSPCTSSLKGSNRSRSKSPGGRKSNRHVTYDEKVVIRDSGTSESITDLSDRDCNESSGQFSTGTSLLSSDMSSSSQRDYTSELRELSQQIVKEYSGLSTDDSVDFCAIRDTGKRHTSTPNGTTKTAQVSGKPAKCLKVYTENERKKIVVNEDYDNERSISYRAAINNKYSDDITQEAEEVMGKISPREELPVGASPDSVTEPRDPKSRQKDIDQDEIEKSRLTPAKRSLSQSIGNFFRRLSPHVGRRSKKGNLSTASSQSLSPGDDLDGSFRRHNSTSSLSRGKLRRSLMKLMGKSKKGDKSGTSSEDPNQSSASQDNQSVKQTSKSKLYMKSLEDSKGDKNMYKKFKEKSKDKSSSKKSEKVSPKVYYYEMEKPSTTETSLSSSPSGEGLDIGKINPPDTLDVKLVPKTTKSLRAAKISTVSRDDSIGNCSIDPNITGSEKSLTSEGSPSKHVEVGQLLEENVNATLSTPLHASTPQGKTIAKESESGFKEIDKQDEKDLKPTYPPMPIISDTSDFFPTDTPTRTPSYLRISSAVSGYGHYIKYSAYKGIEKRSPYSSTLSLRSSRSDLTTPVSPSEMPIGKIPNIQPPTNWPPLKNEILTPKCVEPVKSEVKVKSVVKTSVDTDPVVNGASSLTETCKDTRVNGGVNGDLDSDITDVNRENGHENHVTNFVSAGDNIQDGDYFLGLAEAEERRLSDLCSKCDGELLSDSVTEEASGKIRAAVGKANLLISQKFRQFQDLCQQHKHPDPDPEAKPTKPEDLQGFWDMVKLQIDDLDDMFTEIDMMRQNGWREIRVASRRSSSSSRSSPKSSSLTNVSNTSTPSHTPGSKRRTPKVKDTPESSPERSQKAKSAAKARDDARKKMLAEKRAAMKQQRQQEAENVEIFVTDNGSKSNSPSRTSGSDGGES